MKEENFPALYRAADSLSNSAQKRFLRALTANLISLVLTACTAILSEPQELWAIAQFVLVLITLSTSIYLGVKKPLQTWYKARALAESIKTISWRYMMKAEPYDSDDVTATNNFSDFIRNILNDHKEIISLAIPEGSLDQITDAMRAARASSLSERISTYRDCRIIDQQNWYLNKARYNSKCATMSFVIMILINALAVAFAALRIRYPNFSYWPTDVCLAAGASVMAWIQAKRYQELAASYNLTVHDIGSVKSKEPTDGLEKTFSAFVGDSENAFSREHTQWLARRDQPSI